MNKIKQLLQKIVTFLTTPLVKPVPPVTKKARKAKLEK